MKRCLSTDNIGRAGRENIWLSVMMYWRYYARSVVLDLRKYEHAPI